MAINTGFGFDDAFQCSSFQNQPQLTQVYGIQNTGLGRLQGEAASSKALSHHQSMAFSHSLAAEVEKQRREIDFYLRVQIERLRYAIKQQRKQQLAALINQLESKTLALMREKELALEKARKKTEQLEEWLRMAETQREASQRAAKQNEAMVIGLNNMVEQAKEKFSSCGVAEGGGAAVAAGDAESVCGSSSHGGGRGNIEKGREAEGKKIGYCRCCNSRRTCVVLLPCKHLCSCKTCEAFLELCPACRSVKAGSIEVFL
ncbi:hypothetical protein Nepgr_018398 [Nepenthes gracilis]|uniref:RING-type domain-containing protein n=1 Tax=Nepenthes gracilis TaxID=150966 RepID=A0AAD3XT17_NEPGR|nr:hypothetical protein Nepgr_018398 [Nepenthes gracilis]